MTLNELNKKLFLYRRKVIGNQNMSSKYDDI